MPQNKNQHYVPQFYLRKFSLDKRSIAVFNLNNPQNFIKNASIKGQCSKNYLYGKNEDLETIIQEFEKDGCNTIRHLESNLKITDEIKSKILKYISFQYSRTPIAAQRLGEFKETLFNEIEKVLEINYNEDTIKDIKKDTINEDFSKDLWESIFIGIQTTISLMDLDFVLLKNDTEIEFVTSDTALWLHNIWTQNYKNFQNSLGYSTKGLILFFPLTPRLGIFFYDSEIYNISRRKIKRHILELTSTKDIRNLNKMFFETAQNSIYFTGDDKTYKSIVFDFVPKNIRKEVSGFSVEVFGTNDKIIGATYLGNETKINLEFLQLTHYANLILPRNRIGKHRENSCILFEEYKRLNGFKN